MNRRLKLQKDLLVTISKRLPYDVLYYIYRSFIIHLKRDFSTIKLLQLKRKIEQEKDSYYDKYDYNMDLRINYSVCINSKIFDEINSSLIKNRHTSQYDLYRKLKKHYEAELNKLDRFHRILQSPAIEKYKTGYVLDKCNNIVVYRDVNDVIHRTVNGLKVGKGNQVVFSTSDMSKVVKACSQEYPHVTFVNNQSQTLEFHLKNNNYIQFRDKLIEFLKNLKVPDNDKLFLCWNIN